MTFAPKGQEFWLKNGKSLNSLHMLKEELPSMSNDIYDNHVNDDKNDFAQWVQDSMNDIELAGKMKKAKNKFHMRHIVHKHLDENDKSIFDSWNDSVNNILGDIKHQNINTSLKFKVWISVFVVVSISALFLFFAMLF